MAKSIKKIGVLTSGGDAPGMNACIRAVVRAGLYYGYQVVGIMRGYQGLIEADFKNMTSANVSGIIHRGGTILKSARSEEFKTEEGMEAAYENVKAEGIGALVAIGGDGTFKGANEFSQKYGISCIGVPGTIDNDLFGTDYTIGYDTALNTVVEAIDKIRDTASSHDRLFFVEVMGRDVGFIALRSGIACGAEDILIPETKTDIKALAKKLKYRWRRKKSSSIVIVAEGDEAGGAIKIKNEVEKLLDDKYNIRVTILGHIQRGGAPTCFDRVSASQLGVAAVEALNEGKSNVMVGLVNNKVETTPIENAVKHHAMFNKNLTHIADILAT